MSKRRRSARVRHVARLAGAALAAAAPAGFAQTAPERVAAPPTTVSELIVTASKTVSELVITANIKCEDVGRINDSANGPKVVSTYPASGQTVRPGLVMVRITFDAPVACAGGLTDFKALPNPCPDRVQHMVLSYDRRTVRTVCRLDPDTHYAAWLSRTAQYAFFSLNSVPARPYKLDFATSAEGPITHLCEAVSQDEDTVRVIKARRELDCTAPLDEAGLLLEAEIRRLDQQARVAQALALAKAAAGALGERR